jgi:galactose mutarotase-like enzyme
VIALEAGPLQAGFAPGAGMVCHSLRHDGAELLTQRDGVEGYARTGRWMGVPLLHPWANRLAGWDYEALGRRVELAPLAGEVVVRDRKTGLPIHGVLPRPWTVLEHDGARVAAELAPAQDAAFPFAHRMLVEAELSVRALRIATTLEALDGEVPVAFGWHPWFTLPGAARAAYAVELPAMRRLQLDDRHLPTGAAEAAAAYAGALPDRELDDAFDEVADGAAFAVAGGGRLVTVTFDGGYPCAQVFAPPDKDLICFEPMTAPADALRSGAFAVAAPGRPYRAAFTIAVDRG